MSETEDLRVWPEWPCANYRAPATCLTAPSTDTGRCDWCSGQHDAVLALPQVAELRAYRARAEAAEGKVERVEALAEEWLRLPVVGTVIGSGRAQAYDDGLRQAAAGIRTALTSDPTTHESEEA